MAKAIIALHTSACFDVPTSLTLLHLLRSFVDMCCVDFLIDFFYSCGSRSLLKVLMWLKLVGWLIGDPGGTGEVKTPDRLIRARPAVMVVVVVNTHDGDALPSRWSRRPSHSLLC